MNTTPSDDRLTAFLAWRRRKALEAGLVKPEQVLDEWVFRRMLLHDPKDIYALEDLRLLTQAEAGRLELNPRPAAVKPLVEAVVARFAPLAQDAEIAVNYEVAPALPSIYVDASRTQQVFDNLLANALRHTPPGGEISITARTSGPGVEFVVANPGELAPDELAHLFDRFWRADAARQRDAAGSGLGLAITKQLVVLQHGAIRAEAHDGTIAFIVDLPAAA